MLKDDRTMITTHKHAIQIARRLMCVFVCLFMQNATLSLVSQIHLPTHTQHTHRTNNRANKYKFKVNLCRMPCIASSPFRGRPPLKLTDRPFVPCANRSMDPLTQKGGAPTTSCRSSSFVGSAAKRLGPHACIWKYLNIYVCVCVSGVLCLPAQDRTALWCAHAHTHKHTCDALFIARYQVKSAEICIHGAGAHIFPARPPRARKRFRPTSDVRWHRTKFAHTHTNTR